MPPSPFDDVVEAVRAALNAKRADLSQRSAAIEGALRAYERAVELEIAETFASEHGLKQPAARERAADAALNLARAVAALPELAERAAAKTTRATPEPESEVAATAAEPRRKPRPYSGKLVIIGALSGREKALAPPAELSAEIEWIDTERDGVHAIGNLPQRIKQGRVCGVVILDRVVSHKHSEPAVAAAREAHVPVVFAGQGGRASLLRAFAQVNEMIRERS
jgi:hypothetical protein